MGIPDISSIKRIRGALTEVKTVACVNCKKPLWELHNVNSGNYHLTRKISIGTVPAWSEYWSKDGKTPLKIECPYCSEPFYQVLQGPNGYTVPKMYIVELDGPV